VAEARLLRGDLAGAEAAVSEAIPILRKLGGHHEHWRALALLAAARQARPDVAAAREELTRELRQLRLTWGEPSYSGWLRRTDVRALLAAGGVTGEER
jgi:hypothetical protein